MPEPAAENKILRENFVFNNWTLIRQVLQQPETPGAAEGAEDNQTSKADEEALRDYFGDERFSLIRAESLRARAENIRERIGNVILLPGIMGSHLSVIERNPDDPHDVRDIDHIWLNLWRIVKGDLERLRLDPGNPKKNLNDENVEATGVLGWYYGLAIETLQAVPFPYDWRLDVFDAADRLDKFIDVQFEEGNLTAGKPVRFVAHSMGGLVVRAFIAKYPEKWKDDSRLIMLGTPNAGSYSAVKGLMGKNETAAKLAKIDLFHSPSELSNIINSFYGLYQLCPSKTTNNTIYTQSFWRDFSDVQFGYLAKVLEFHQKLLDAKDTVNKDTMIYIAGAGFETPVSLEPTQDGAYDFQVSLDGDGVVSHELGLLKDVKTYFVKETHADLLNNLDVLKAIKDILLGCPSKHLTRQKPSHAEKDRSTNPLNRSLKLKDDVRQAEIVAHKIRDIADEVMRERERENRSASDDAVKDAAPVSPDESSAKRKIEEQDEKDIKKIRNRGKEQGLTQALVYDAEKKLLRSLLGGDLDKPENPRFVRGKRAARNKEVKTEKKTKIKVRLRLAKIEKAAAPVIVVGQYQDLPPKGSVGAVDRKIGDLISLTHQNNMFGAGLGEIFVIPISNKKAAEAKTGEKPTINLSELVEVVLVAGMGQFNSFNRDALRYLMLNVVLSALNLGYEKIATVLIGSNLSRYTTERATISLFEGVADALRRFPKAAGKGIELEIYEVDEARAESAGETIKDLKTGKIADEDLNNIALEFNGLEKDSELADNKSAGRGARANPVDEITRLTFKRENGSFHLSALTTSAAIPERRVPVKNFVVETLIEELRMPKSIEEQIRFGRLLHILAIPEEFQGYVDSNQTLVLLLNREAAAIPWELVKYGGKTSTKSFGIDLRLTRQFVSADAPIPGVAPPLNSEFKALIIADPAEDARLRLPGARMEGEQLRAFFEKLRKKHRKLLDAGQPAIDFQMDYRIGYEQCDVVEILSLIATEEYDLVHFAGHGIFNEKTPNESGWIFGRDAKTEELIVLSAQEIFPLRRVPRIVFSNACFSAQLGSTKMCEKVPTFESNKSLAGLAEAFFLHGIENYIGTGWEVNDIYAINFAKRFYEETLDSQSSANYISTLGEALSRARETVYNQTTKHHVLDSSWGAYQHYGNPNDRLVVLENKQDDAQDDRQNNDGDSISEAADSSKNDASTQPVGSTKPGKKK